jgi:hypothetical protein
MTSFPRKRESNSISEPAQSENGLPALRLLKSASRLRGNDGT